MVKKPKKSKKEKFKLFLSKGLSDMAWVSLGFYWWVKGDYIAGIFLFISLNGCAYLLEASDDK